MIILDCYCKAGGTSTGFWQGGFDVVGIDKDPQPNYPFEFIQGDVTRLKPSWVRRHFDAVVGGPPCQASSITRHLHPHIEYPELIPPTREIFKKTGLPYVIENVMGAALVDPVMLCGSMFGLRVRRHRIFETNFKVKQPECDHEWQDLLPMYKTGVGKSRNPKGYRETGVVTIAGGNQLMGGNDLFHGSVAMGIDWMTRAELTQAIPPVYTRYISHYLRRHLAT